MSFWGLSDGESAAETTGEFDAGGGNNEPIPDGTSVLAMPDEAGWKEDRNGVEHLAIRWTVLKPEAYQNRKVFHKLFVSDDDPRAKDPAKKRDKALRMLAAIDKNAGGKLGKKDGRPSSDEIALALINKQMVIRLGVWEMQGDNGAMSGNWVQSVSPKSAEISEGPKAKPKRAPLVDDLGDDDVPF